MCSVAFVVQQKETTADHTTQMTGSHASADHSMDHERSRRLLHQNADDLRQVDSNSWRQPCGLKSRATPTLRDHTSTIAVVSNSTKFNVGGHRVGAINLNANTN
ncbi:hypothetical protein TBK1r_64510 [Stieleria magnilauensis]|uniref:Uncharacterized protein n=1 Tax=Stieleria magnilauensis TaxID=2527963 RepID=A0ABX5Y387_9BACT|nr:hypothetical protein TBK1r_64510 [Planctomycetes bacterium TBK1r]